VVAAVAMPLGWAVGSMIVSAPFKTAWVGIATTLVLGSVIHRQRYRHRTRLSA
jgi:hypothetical protein